jgi:hypothetical protein
LPKVKHITQVVFVARETEYLCLRSFGTLGSLTNYETPQHKNLAVTCRK